MNPKTVFRKDGVTFSIGDYIRIHLLVTCIKDTNITDNGVFVSTEYGDFNIDIIELIPKHIFVDSYKDEDCKMCGRHWKDEIHLRTREIK